MGTNARFIIENSRPSADALSLHVLFDIRFKDSGFILPDWMIYEAADGCLSVSPPRLPQINRFIVWASPRARQLFIARVLVEIAALDLGLFEEEAPF
jgi:hypothetical protein